jgi:hypothetical protein
VRIWQHPDSLAIKVGGCWTSKSCSAVQYLPAAATMLWQPAKSAIALLMGRDKGSMHLRQEAQFPPCHG